MQCNWDSQDMSGFLYIRALDVVCTRLFCILPYHIMPSMPMLLNNTDSLPAAPPPPTRHVEASSESRMSRTVKSRWRNIAAACCGLHFHLRCLQMRSAAPLRCLHSAAPLWPIRSRTPACEIVPLATSNDAVKTDIIRPQPKRRSATKVTNCLSMSHPPNALPRSCLECRRRKIKCDRALPCSYCAKVKVQCSYSPPSATSQKASSTAADEGLVARIQTIEHELEAFEQDLSGIWQLLQPKSSSWLADRSCAHMSMRDPHKIVQGTIETRGNSTCPCRDDERCSLFGSASTSTLKSLHPPIGLISFIWQKYLESVEPVLKILHSQTVQKQFVDFIRGRGVLDQPTECVMFAIYYSVAITMTAEECQSEFNEGKREILTR